MTRIHLAGNEIALNPSWVRWEGGAMVGSKSGSKEVLVHFRVLCSKTVGQLHFRLHLDRGFMPRSRFVWKEEDNDDDVTDL